MTIADQVQDIAAFVRAEADKDREWARTTLGEIADARASENRDTFEWIGRRVLAEADAKRHRLDVIQDMVDDPPAEDDGWHANMAYRIDAGYALRLALTEVSPYTDRPGYRTEWSPE